MPLSVKKEGWWKTRSRPVTLRYPVCRALRGMRLGYNGLSHFRELHLWFYLGAWRGVVKHAKIHWCHNSTLCGFLPQRIAIVLNTSYLCHLARTCSLFISDPAVYRQTLVTSDLKYCLTLWKREREKVRKDSRSKDKTFGERRETLYIWGKGTQAVPARPSDKDRMRAKTLGWWVVKAWDRPQNLVQWIIIECWNNLKS
jgi:hypothetical protein